MPDSKRFASTQLELSFKSDFKRFNFHNPSLNCLTDIMGNGSFCFWVTLCVPWLLSFFIVLVFFYNIQWWYRTYVIIEILRNKNPPLFSNLICLIGLIPVFLLEVCSLNLQESVSSFQYYPRYLSSNFGYRQGCQCCLVTPKYLFFLVHCKHACLVYRTWFWSLVVFV